MWDFALQQVVSDSVARWAFMWKVTSSILGACAAFFFLRIVPHVRGIFFLRIVPHVRGMHCYA